MKAQIGAAKILYERDRENDVAGVYLPHAYEKKSPGAGKSWKWFWVFPSSKLSNDPRANVIRRHHILDSTVNRAIQNAVKAAGIPKLVTAHTLRHSYATHQVLSGIDIKSIQEALGHSDIRTTEIYLRLARAMRGEMGSPLDRLAEEE